MKILLVEDDPNFSHILTYQLEQEGFLVDTCDDGSDVFYYFQNNTYDLVLLDRMLPHVDGLTILKKMRGRKLTMPVIILTALGEVDDKITGLDSGADDYLVKPFEFKELMARIRSIFRRPTNWKAMDEISFADISLSIDNCHLKGPLGSCTLSQKEAAVMELFLRNPNQVLPRKTILSNVWDAYGNVEDGNLDNYIHFVRRRLKSVTNTIHIQTIRGVGYQLLEK